MTIHNVFTFYQNVEGDGAMVSFHRPQNWGDPDQWQYITTSIWVPNDDLRFESRRCHIWCHPSHDRFEFLREIGGLLFSFYFPGSPGELCDRSHLHGDDFWSEDWGKMPPHWDDYDFDDLDSDDAKTDLADALNNPNNIPLALTPEYATIVASLMQLGLRHPAVKTMTPHLYQVGKPFVDTLIDRVVAKNPEHGDKIRTAFEQAWHESNDITSAEFDALGIDFTIKPEPNN